MALPALVGAAFANNTGSGMSSPATGVLPAGIATGDICVLAITVTSTAATLSSVTNPGGSAGGGGWVIAAAFDNGANARSWLIYKTGLTSADSSTTVTATFGGTQRWTIAGGVWTNVQGFDLSVQTQDAGSTTTTYAVAAYTPTNGSELAVLLICIQHANTTADGVNTVPSGFTKLAETATTFTGASDSNTAVATRQLGGVSTIGATSGTLNGASHINTYVALLIPSAPVTNTFLIGTGTLAASATPALSATGSFSGSGSLTVPTLTPGEAATASLSGTGTLAATGTPAESATASLSGTGTLAAAGHPAATATAGLSGTGTLAPVGHPGAGAGASLSGTGTLTAPGRLPALAALAALSSTGTLIATGVPTFTAAAVFSGIGTLYAHGPTTRPTFTRVPHTGVEARKPAPVVIDGQLVPQAAGWVPVTAGVDP